MKYRRYGIVQLKMTMLICKNFYGRHGKNGEQTVRISFLNKSRYFPSRENMQSIRFYFSVLQKLNGKNGTS